MQNIVLTKKDYRKIEIKTERKVVTSRVVKLEPLPTNTKNPFTNFINRITNWILSGAVVRKVERKTIRQFANELSAH